MVAVNTWTLTYSPNKYIMDMNAVSLKGGLLKLADNFMGVRLGNALYGQLGDTEGMLFSEAFEHFTKR